MSVEHRILVLAGFAASLALGLGWAGNASAKPAWAITNGNSCRDNCHVNEEAGRMQVTAAEVLDIGTQLDGNVRGPLDVFRVEPGNAVNLTMEVLNGDAVFAVQFKRLEKSGQLNDLANFMTWLEDNLETNPWTLQEDTNPPYFTKDNGNDGGLPANEAGAFSFDLFIDPVTPLDVYDLEFAVAGLNGDEQPFYQDEHFYLEVVPEPAVGASAMTMIATLGAVFAARRRGSS